MISVADLFAGAGGMSTGCLLAAEARGERVELVAMNHWPIAVETHTRNHPEARHFCAPVETLDPRVAIPGGKLDLLIAAPECTHHSTARGGKPINDQSRASAWHILRWVELLRVESVLIENVPEFQTWGPIGANGRPLKSRKGETFRAFIAALESYGYRVEWKVLNAADYGAATTRRRLFILARRGRTAIAWPAPTHSRTGDATLFGGRRKWRAAREVIDWTLPSQSIFTRKRPLKPATLRRILEGLRRFGGDAVKPFLVAMEHGGRITDVDAPVPTITTARGGAFGVAEPVIVKLTHGDRKRERSIDEPLPTITSANRGELGIAEPFLIPFMGEREGQTPRARSVDEPLQTVTTQNPIGLCEPFVLQQQSGGVARRVSEPVPTVSTDGAIALVEPFIVQPAHGAGGGRGDSGRVQSVDAPVGTIPASNRFAVVEPFLTRYYGSGSGLTPKSVDEPLDTVTARDRFGLVQPVVNGYVLDIRFRMLQLHELAAAMSFPQSYNFAGNKGDGIRQVGNAVDVRMARALCGAVMDARGVKRPKSTDAEDAA